MAHLFPHWVRLFFITCYLVQINTAIKCYICGSQGDVPSCSNFQVDNPKFQQDCSSHKSCKISRKISDNGILSRSCEYLNIEDCKTANSVEYCYCRRDYCNNISPSDEEDEYPGDFLEGSGKQMTEEKDHISTDIITSTDESTIHRNALSESNLATDDKRSSTGASLKNFNKLILPLCIMCLLSYKATIVSN